MTSQDLVSFNNYLKKNIESPLSKFLKKHSLLIPKQSFETSFPNYLKKLEPLSKTLVRCSYPYVKRDTFNKNEGYKIEKANKLRGNIVYLGNVCAEVILEKKNRIRLKEYSFKFWYSDNKYIPLNNSNQRCQEINFNFRIEKDSRHRKDDLEFHASFLHTQPRIYSKELSMAGFLNYVEDQLLLLTEEIANGLWVHISEVNRLK